MLFQGRERTEANEQRLPLKKRHRHISTAVPATPEPPKVDSVKNELSMTKASEKANCDKELRIEKEDKDKLTTKIDPRPERMSVPKSSNLMAETPKPMKPDAKVVKHSSEELPKRSEDALLPNNNVNKKYEVMNSMKRCEVAASVTKKCEVVAPSVTKKYEEPISKRTEVTQVPDIVIKNARPLEASQAMSMPCVPQVVVNKVVKPEPVTRAAGELNTSTRATTTTTTTTTPKKRHRLEVELSHTPATATRATSGLVKGKLEKEVPKSKEKELSIKVPVNKSPKATKELVLKETSNVPLPKQESACDNSPKVFSADKKVEEVKEKPYQDVAVEKCHNAVDLFVQTSEPVLESEPPKESSGTHSDSDIPSEHEPLYDSDQSGFSSDKEGPIEPPVKVPQKRLKKKRELRSPIPKVTDKPVPAEVTEHNEPPPSKKKKKLKRRKRNRTGFPTIRKKKRKTKDLIDPKEIGTEVKPIGEPCDIKNSLAISATPAKPDSLNMEVSHAGINTPLTCPPPAHPNTMPRPNESDLNFIKYEGKEGFGFPAAAILPDSEQLAARVNRERLETLPSKDSVPVPAPRPRGRPKKTSTEIKSSSRAPSVSPSQSPEKGPKQLRDSLRERRSTKPPDTVPQEKKIESEQDEQQLKKMLERVATGIGYRTRRKRDLSEESVRTVQSEGKRPRRHAEEEVQLTTFISC